jgi:hypothetical protein
MGIGGGCRMDELHKMKIDDIEDRDNILINTSSRNKNE